jgi:hypothetical protein
VNKLKQVIFLAAAPDCIGGRAFVARPARGGGSNRPTQSLAEGVSNTDRLITTPQLPPSLQCREAKS